MSVIQAFKSDTATEFNIQDSRQLYYLIDDKVMTWFAVKMELYYTLNYSYHDKIYTTQMSWLNDSMQLWNVSCFVKLVVIRETMLRRRVMEYNIWEWLSVEDKEDRT